jgi:hypothetical protein
VHGYTATFCILAAMFAFGEVLVGTLLRSVARSGCGRATRARATRTSGTRGAWSPLTGGVVGGNEVVSACQVMLDEALQQVVELAALPC